MCDPVSITMAAATAVSAAGQLQGGAYASKVARNQATVAQYNKELAKEGADDAIKRGQDDQRKLGREIASRVGQQEARIAANNVDITTGSAARVIEDTQMLGAEDQAAISENVARQVRSQQIDAWGYESAKRAAISEGKQAKTAAAFGAASTILGGASQYSKFKAGRG